MSAKNLILTYQDDEFSWVRCEGKGSFLMSPTLKRWAESEIERGVKCLVVDLNSCLGMDSTFMGTLAGLALRLMKTQGDLQIAEPGEKNKKSLKGLGLDALMKVDPKNAFWRDRIQEIRAKLEPLDDSLSNAPGASYVLEAHQKLCEADDKNTEKFETVLDFLEAEVKSKDAKHSG